jgi:ribonucleoside-diphosphate reductase beta chain
MKQMSFFTDPAQKRLVLKPIQHPILWDVFKQQQSVLWTTEEIDWSNDLKDWNTLEPEAQDFILHIIAFFASSDTLVIDNIMDQFMSEVQVAECRAFYTLQSFVETIHSETYSLALEKFAPPHRQEQLFNAISNEPTIKAKGDFAQKYMNPQRPFAERLWAFCIFEGVLFSASFASLYWLRTKDKCKGLTFSNELIQRDEGLHAKFAIEMLNMLPPEENLTEESAHQILKEAVALEEAFVRAALPQTLTGLNAAQMIEYVKHVADRLLSMLDAQYTPIWSAKQPLVFMDMISIDAKTNFFERRVSEYQLAHVGKNDSDTKCFSLEAEF